MFDFERPNIVVEEISEDKKCIRMTICDNNNPSESKKQGFLKRLFHQVFG